MVRPGTEQSTVYTCEDLVESQIGSRMLASNEVAAWLERVCEREDVDVPVVTVRRAARTILASADGTTHSICLRGRTVTTGTVLHELAHLTCGAGSHGVLFRDELVRLGRAHVSVEWAALLHRTFTDHGLEMSPWPASAHRRG